MKECQPSVVCPAGCGEVGCYHKIPKDLDTRKQSCNYPKIGTLWFYHREMRPKDADGMANSVDPDQTAPEQSDQGLHCLLFRLFPLDRLLYCKSTLLKF